MSTLYNKYRPTSFSEFYGQQVIKDVLIKSIEQRKYVQSYIFFGPHGTGKTSMARVFAKALMCTDFHGDICNKCVCCSSVNSGTLDVHEIDAASYNGVEFIRELVDGARYMPLDLPKKIYIIDEAHMLSTQSWNAFLKIIEEPPEHVFFIFSTTNVQKIIPTIISRCQKLSFSLLDNESLTNMVQDISDKEGFNLQSSTHKKMIEASKGSARELLSLLNVSVVDERGIFSGEVGEVELLSFLRLIQARDITKAIQVVIQIRERGDNLLLFFENIFSILLDLLVFSKTNKIELVASYPSFVKEKSLLDLPCQELCDLLLKNFQFFKLHSDILEISKLNVMEMINLVGVVEGVDGVKKFLKHESIINNIQLHSDQELRILPEQDSQPPAKKTETTPLPATVTAPSPKKTTLKNTKTPTQKSSPMNSIELEDKRIIYVFENTQQPTSKKILDLLQPFINDEQSEFHLMFSGMHAKFNIIASNYSVVVCFEDITSKNRFDLALASPETQSKLNEIVQQKVYWLSIVFSDVKKYWVQKNKTNNPLKAHELFPELVHDTYVNALKQLQKP